MGEILNLTNKYNGNNKEKTKKRPFEIRKDYFAKDLANLTFNPNLNKKYKLNSRYRKLQIGARVTIAALIASGSLIGFNSLTNNNHTEQLKTEITSEILSKEDVMNTAEDKLKELIFGENYEEKSNIDDIYIDYIHNEVENTDSIKVSHLSKLNRYEDFSYTRGTFVRNQNNAKEVNNLLNSMININKDKTVSKKDLAQLNNVITSLNENNTKYKLENNKILVASQEKDIDIER